jgi:hypothetical protein
MKQYIKHCKNYAKFYWLLPKTTLKESMLPDKYMLTAAVITTASKELLITGLSHTI